MSIHIPQHAYPARRVSWTKRDVLLFAASIGCSAEQLHFLYVCYYLSLYLHLDRI